MSERSLGESRESPAAGSAPPRTFLNHLWEARKWRDGSAGGGQYPLKRGATRTIGRKATQRSDHDMRGARTASGAGRPLERLFRTGAVGGLTDAQLLEQFASGDDDDEAAEAAFAAIVGRHGPMVLGVCRSVLRDAHAAEDAFQATFLVLARRARAVGGRGSLGNWLYGVALRTARKARTAAARRLARDGEAASLRPLATADPHPDDGDTRDERARILHEEIGRLPGTYRSAVVVCYLEGMTQEQAARQLRLAESTVRGRLARARKLLGRRLTLRGIGLSSGLLALGAPADAADARIPEAAVEPLARAARLFGKSSQATGGAVSATAHRIARGVLFTMGLPSFQTVAAAILAVAGIAAGTPALSQRAAEAQAPGPAPRSKTLAEILSAVYAQAQDPGARRSALVRDGERDGAQSPAIAADLVKSVPSPILRAFPVSKDCMILSYIADWAHGNVDNIGVANNHGGVRTLIDWPEIKPDLASAPDRKFLLALYSRTTTSHSPAGPIHAFAIIETWPELTSWKTQPAYHLEPAATYQFEPGEGWKLFDVTPIVRDQAGAGRNTHGVLLRFLSEDFSERGVDWSGYQFVSREGTGEWARRRPVLLVVKAGATEKPAAH
jgi:RNA polymerase sigma factor (sigma-70 family)